MKLENKILLFVIFSICSSVFCQNTNDSLASIYTKVSIPTSTGAMCLDGTPQIFYWKQGFGSGINKFLVYFEGGGWCYGLSLNESIQNCYERSLSFMGSTINDTQTVNYSQYGILSSDQNLNPNFYNYNVAFVRYCDGTGHQGYASEPVIYNNSNVYFRGYNCTIEIFNTLMNNYNMSEPEILLIMGDSAGGLATYNWISYVSELFEGKNTKVLAGPDSGLFLDFIDQQTQNYTYQQSFQNMMLLSNKEIDPVNTECVKDNPTEKWKCLFAPYLINYIHTPVFMIQSLYDEWSLYNILGEPCIFENEINSLTPCNFTEYSAVMQYKSATLTTITNILQKQAQNNWGAWSPACVFHVLSLTPFTFNSEVFNIPMNSNNTLSYTLGQWVSNLENNITNQKSIFIDSVDWPNNTPCSSTKGGSIFWLFSA